MRSIKIATMVILSAVLFTFPASGLDLQPGKYEITAKVEMTGMPGEMPPQTTTQCLTKNNPVPDGSASSQGCMITEMKTDGNKVTYKMECDQQGMKMTGKGEITYKGKSFEGKFTMEMGTDSGGMTMKTVTTGKWIGECDK